MLCLVLCHGVTHILNRHASSATEYTHSSVRVYVQRNNQTNRWFHNNTLDVWACLALHNQIRSTVQARGSLHAHICLWIHPEDCAEVVGQFTARKPGTTDHAGQNVAPPTRHKLAKKLHDIIVQKILHRCSCTLLCHVTTDHASQNVAPPPHHHHIMPESCMTLLNLTQAPASCIPN